MTFGEMADLAEEAAKHMRIGIQGFTQIFPEELAIYTTLCHWASRLEERAKGFRSAATSTREETR